MSDFNFKESAMKMWDTCIKNMEESGKKVNIEENSIIENKMYMVTVKRDADSEFGVEIVGIFNTEDKANKAKSKVVKWMKDNEYDNYLIFITLMEINRIGWYEISESL